MAQVSDIVNVSLQTAGKTIQPDNINNVMMITSDTTYLSSARRFASYKDPVEVALDFGTNNIVTSFAETFFAQRVTPLQAGGILYIGFWRAKDETTSATAATLEGGEITDSNLIDLLNQISDGAFDIDVDGSTVNVTGVDMQADTDLSEVASSIDTALTGASCSFSNNQFIITSGTTGATSTLTYASSPSSGTDISSLLNLQQTQGGVLTQGTGSTTLSAETKDEALTTLLSLVKFRGYMFIDNVADSEVSSLASTTQANNILGYDVFEDESTHLNASSSNPAFDDVRTAGLENYRMLFSINGNRQFAAAYMARMHSVLFGGDNTALTMHLKDLVNISPETLTTQQERDAKRIGFDIYVSFKGVGKVVSSGKNNFTDNVYNKIALKIQLETDLFNLLAATPTKIPQTVEGVDTVTDQIKRTLDRFVTAGVIAPGTWTLPQTFGNPDQLKESVSEKGYYIFANPLSQQSQTSRQARNSPLIQVAIKLAGAIHSIDLIVNINK